MKTCSLRSRHPDVCVSTPGRAGHQEIDTHTHTHMCCRGWRQEISATTEIQYRGWKKERLKKQREKAGSKMSRFNRWKQFHLDLTSSSRLLEHYWKLFHNTVYSKLNYSTEQLSTTERKQCVVRYCGSVVHKLFTAPSDIWPCTPLLSRTYSS